MTLISTGLYERADANGKEEDIQAVITAYVESIEGDDDDEKRVNLPLIKKKVHETVDYVMDNLPDGVTGVDGYLIEPMLVTIVNDKIDALPAVEEEEL